VSTQKTFDKQTATFLGVLAQNVPELSGDEMQYYIEKPTELKERLFSLRFSITDFVGRFCPEINVNLKFIGLVQGWDFLIMQSATYPEVGIAVANSSGSLGSGFCLSLNGRKFVGPCGCCRWIQEVEPLEAERLIRKTCADNGIRYLLFKDWWQTRCTHEKKGLKQGVGGLYFVDPHEPWRMGEHWQIEMLNKEHFSKAFEGFSYTKSSGGKSEAVPLSALFKNDKK
jgi:hypothetical protein